MSIHDSKESILSHVDQELEALGIEGVQASDLVDVTTDYMGEAIGAMPKDELGW